MCKGEVNEKEGSGVIREECLILGRGSIEERKE